MPLLARYRVRRVHDPAVRLARRQTRRVDADEPREGLTDRLASQLIREGAIASTSIEDAFRRVPRHWFLPDAALEEVYRDLAVVTHRDSDGLPISSSSQPTIMARMLRQLDVQPGHQVLEIGTGTGYNTALLAQLVGPEGAVTTVEVSPDIAAAARRHLDHAAVSNTTVVAGDGWSEIGQGSRFDRIEATVGVWDLSTAWVEQLELDGIIVVPLWLRAGLQASVAFKKLGEVVQSVSIVPCGFMRLRGPGAGQATYEPVGAWAASFDEPSPDSGEALTLLLQNEPRTEPIPPLPAGWFTPIALTQPGAIRLFSHGPQEPLVYSGILDPSGPGLAAISSGPARPDTLHTFGSGNARQRLEDVLNGAHAARLEDLTIVGIPAGTEMTGSSTLTTLPRPNFTFAVSHP